MHLSVPPGTELHQCQLVALPSETDIESIGMSHSYTIGSHHFLLFATNLDSIPSDLTGQYDCTRGDEPIMQHATGILYGGQSPDGHVTFPPGVGLKVKAKQIFMMQAHYLNPAGHAIDATINMSFTKAAAGSVTTEAGFLIFYDPFIYLAPQAAASSAISCPVTGDITLMYGFTHYHQRGKAMKVWNDPDATTQAADPFHETNDWEHPADFVGSKTLAKGSFVRLQCDYVNPDANDVFQGPNAATSEMCVYAGLYYPKLGGQFPFCENLSIVGRGTDTCLTQASCLNDCPVEDIPQFVPGGVLVGPCWEKCVANGCRGATDTALTLSKCVDSSCHAECAAGPTECSTCATSKCATEFGACAAHTCAP
jgi:hypothetical protein